VLGVAAGSGERSTAVEFPVPQANSSTLVAQIAPPEDSSATALSCWPAMICWTSRTADQALVVVIIAASRIEAGRPHRETRWGAMWVGRDQPDQQQPTPRRARLGAGG